MIKEIIMRTELVKDSKEPCPMNGLTYPLSFRTTSVAIDDGD